ncbi:GNAT family N-acetyltransferase [Nitratireductor pacificus]|uniref:N-acetyltransferase GCN5 n=1 Tax=Nitratireductor pacificus pht-3B TaxID=391937 RepID=K2ME15_9HYPH|nr:GNAT family N-acetyltransferase [Nitratireductor pacificus]EKF19010.1 N-acetyltransferase GCN5 [Nitratireductor pacificus pht-3B]
MQNETGPNDAGRIAFAPVTAEHYPLLLDWLNRPHVREWWGDPETEVNNIRAKVEGRDSTRPFIIELDGRPIGYIQYWFIADNSDETTLADAPWLAELPVDAVGIDLTIGEKDLLSRGIGSAAVGLMVRQLLEAGHANIIIDPAPENARAVHAYEKAGFRAVPHLVGRTEGALIMQYDTNNGTNT